MTKTKKTTKTAVKEASTKKAQPSRTKKTLAEIKQAQQAFYRKNRKRLLAYANNYYAEHKESVLVKAKARYARKRKDYFCTECGKKLPRELSGHHLYCAKCLAQREKMLNKAGRLRAQYRKANKK